MWSYSRDRIVVSTSRCGRDNPGSNPGHGILFSHVLKQVKIIAIGVALDLSRIFLIFFFFEKNPNRWRQQSSTL